jgi:hypothetical protein
MSVISVGTAGTGALTVGVFVGISVGVSVDVIDDAIIGVIDGAFVGVIDVGADISVFVEAKLTGGGGANPL